MTWLEGWEGSYNGDWYGSSTPEPEGSMRATLRGSSVVSAKLTYEETNEQQLGIYGNQRRVQETNRQIMEVILRAAPHVFSNYYK